MLRSAYWKAAERVIREHCAYHAKRGTPVTSADLQKLANSAWPGGEAPVGLGEQVMITLASIGAFRLAGGAPDGWELRPAVPSPSRKAPSKRSAQQVLDWRRK